MQDILKSIDNKEILIEVLHHSIDYLIGNRDEQHTIRMCHKYGFQNPDDFVLATRQISKIYKNCCTENGDSNEVDLSVEFEGLNPELFRLVTQVLKTRKSEIIRYLIRRNNASEHPALESFDWDTRIIMGDNSFSENIRQLATVTLNCRNPNSKQFQLYFQLNTTNLDKLISTLECAINENEAKTLL